MRTIIIVIIIVKQLLGEPSPAVRLQTKPNRAKPVRDPWEKDGVSGGCLPFTRRGWSPALPPPSWEHGSLGGTVLRYTPREYAARTPSGMKYANCD